MGKFVLLAILAIGISSSKEERYEDAIPLLIASESVISVENYCDYWYWRAICHHQLRQQPEALKAVDNLQNSFAINEMPNRYKAIAFGIKNDLLSWDTEGIDDIERRMGEVSRRLNLLIPDSKTQKQEDEIVKLLDKLIKEKEDQAKADAQAQAEKDKQGKGMPIPSSPANGSPSEPASDSKIMGTSGKGAIDEKIFRKYAENWGGIIPSERAKIVEGIKRDVPEKFKPMIDEYFKSLNRIYPVKGGK